MRLHELTQTHPRKKAVRVGRGIAAGGGKTAGRGTKGQKSRTGANSNIPRTFDGGAANMIQRFPKLKGFKSHRVKPVAVNVARLVPLYKSGEEVSLISLLEKGIINARDIERGIKVVGSSTHPKLNFHFVMDGSLTLSKRLQVEV